MKRRSNEFDRFLLVIRRTVNDYKMNVRCGSGTDMSSFGRGCVKTLQPTDGRGRLQT
jgi:hypothetical protein